MIRLKGLNKILRVGLLAGALLGIATPLMAKPLFTDTELAKRVSVYSKVLNNEDILACNRSVDSTKYFSAGWDYKQKIPSEWKKEFQQCVLDKVQQKIDTKIKATEKERKEKIAKENKEIMQKAKENAKKVMEKFIAFEIKEKSNYVSNEKQLRMIIDRAYETGISRWLDDLHRKYGYKNTEETIEALKERKALIDFIEENNPSDKITLLESSLSDRIVYKRSVSEGLGVIEYSDKKAINEWAHFYNELKGYLVK
ncbi:hypothetical protein [Helicobacter pylori]|uniref:hypothetical protein n=1 Tax=Helicobacter pylori TaxID=210 RepID=UPI001E5BA776|nr:hypothetical protein [Helicobacter pylori]